MGGLFIGLRRVLVAVRTSDFRESLCRMDIGFGLLVANHASHPGRPMYGSFKGLFIYIQGKKGPILIPFAEKGILVTPQALGILRRLGRQGPDQQESKKRE
jgi:hypothetical protein